MAMKNLLPTSGNIPIPVFTPDPEKAVRLTVPAGGNVVWTVPASTGIFCFDPSCPVRITYNANTPQGHRYAANPDSPYGPIGIHPGTATIKFTDTGTGGGNVDIEAM